MTSLNPSLRLALINKAKRQKNLLQKGFTLVELMVVVAIIGVLAGVTVPGFLEAQKAGQASAAKQAAVNEAKRCSSIQLGGVGTYDATGVDSSLTTTTCGNDGTGSFVATGGDVTWTVTITDSVPGEPSSAAVEGND